MSGTALLVVDVQKDFCEGGSLAVEGGAAVAKKISEYIRDHAHEYTTIIASKDWHVDPGSHFSENPDFAESWPTHCVAGLDGSDFHPNLDTTLIRRVFYKGMNDAAYSAFEGITDLTDPGHIPSNDDNYSGFGLIKYLQSRQIAEIDVVGIAADYCVKATALDSHKYGFKTNILKDLTVAVNPENWSTWIMPQLENIGIVVK